MLCLLAGASLSGTVLDDYFCQLYYPSDAAAQGLPACTDVRSAVTETSANSVAGVELNTLQLGNAGMPTLFFVHGWPDNAAEWASQFGAFCYGPGAKFRCVAVTLTNFDPDTAYITTPLSLEDEVDRIASTMQASSPVDTTLVIHDLGSVIGYRVASKHPDLVKRVISFDVASTGTGYQGPGVQIAYQNYDALTWYSTENYNSSQSFALAWDVPCQECVVWQTTWPYCPQNAQCGDLLAFMASAVPPTTTPLLFIWGDQNPNPDNLDPAPARTDGTKFFTQSWLDFEQATPHGLVVEGPGDHWINHRAAGFSNNAMRTWLDSVPSLTRYINAQITSSQAYMGTGCDILKVEYGQSNCCAAGTQTEAAGTCDGLKHAYRQGDCGHCNHTWADIDAAAAPTAAAPTAD